MPEATANPVERVLYREIVSGDLRKFQAESNDTPSGGGARDLRFRPYDEFEDVVRLLFPTERVVERRRNGVVQQVTIFVGRFFWMQNDGVKSAEAIFEPPTTAREGEGRITRVHTYPPLNAKQPLHDGRLIFLLIQRSDGKVWPHFATEGSLRRGEWDEAITNTVLTCLDADKTARRVARGFVDLVNHHHYCDA
jgi:hypothetical protein